MSGIFIAFEGVDGCGKTIQAKLLRDRLTGDGIDVCYTMEPTDNPIGALIRSFLSCKQKTDESAISALFAADRLDHLLNKEYGIINLLEKGTNVLTDRFYLSSIAYQGVTLPMEWVISLNSRCMDIRRPDLHVFLDVSPDTAFERVRLRKKNLDIYEQPSFIKKVREKYFEAIEKLGEKENIIIVDADSSPEAVSERVYAVVSEAFCCNQSNRR